ncbi:uncharacterized protein LOC112588619 [Harpegnathos saltator]|uniref:uncharacterized protein LOC112588619 n=1 Tax=Harpegnathos saltator TaxID=610380 RepID=UPI000DBEE175|nr:uncharacterized protein LOC112588619 [Harpegnathos saltator]
MNSRYQEHGFTEQTKMLLRNIGAQSLIKECKKRKISTDELHKLTKEDFMVLGASEDFAEYIVKIFHNTNEKFKRQKFEQNISDNIKILQVAEKQLALFHPFIAYFRVKLEKEPNNEFVDHDKPISASEVLCITVDYILREINDAELKLKELEDFIIKPKPKPKHKPIYSYMLYYTSISIICIAISKLLISKFWK